MHEAGAWNPWTLILQEQSWFHNNILPLYTVIPHFILLLQPQLVQNVSQISFKTKIVQITWPFFKGISRILKIFNFNVWLICSMKVFFLSTMRYNYWLFNFYSDLWNSLTKVLASWKPCSRLLFFLNFW